MNARAVREDVPFFCSQLNVRKDRKRIIGTDCRFDRFVNNRENPGHANLRAKPTPRLACGTFSSFNKREGIADSLRAIREAPEPTAGSIPPPKR